MDQWYSILKSSKELVEETQFVIPVSLKQTLKT